MGVLFVDKKAPNKIFLLLRLNNEGSLHSDHTNRSNKQYVCSHFESEMR